MFVAKSRYVMSSSVRLLVVGRGPTRHCSKVPVIKPPQRSHITTSPSRSRSSHPDFKQVEASRPNWNTASVFHHTKTVDPSWSFGDGANDSSSSSTTTNTSSTSSPKHIPIDPYEPGRRASLNYKLLTSAVIPRPIAFLSTRSADGLSANLAPFSYFNVVNHDPPLFVVSFTGGGARAKDSLRNVADTRECVLNIVSEHFVEAANAASANAPYGVSEWDISGLTPSYDCETVSCARVAEAVVSVEARLESVREYESRATPGKVTGTLAVFEGTRFWVREDAVNEEKSLIDPAVSSHTALGAFSRSSTR